MSQELLYTSAPRGLKPGSRGFCTVLSTQGMAAPLATALEGLSGYRPIYPTGDERASRNPVLASHLKLQAAGRSWSVLSRIADYGLDYSQRANKLAHHVVIDKSEQPASGPASLLATRDYMRDEWSGEPKVVALKPGARDVHAPSGSCRAWQETAGDAGWAGVLAESFLRDPERLVILLFAPGQEILPLFDEALSLLPPERRWDVTFSTYFTGLATSTTCVWRAMVHDSKEAHESLRFVNALRLDLTSGSLGPATGEDLVAAARSGTRPHAPPARPNKPTGPTEEEFVELEVAHEEFAATDDPSADVRFAGVPQTPPPLAPPRSPRLAPYAVTQPTTRRRLADVVAEESNRPRSRRWIWRSLAAAVLLIVVSFSVAFRKDISKAFTRSPESEVTHVNSGKNDLVSARVVSPQLADAASNSSRTAHENAVPLRKTQTGENQAAKSGAGTASSSTATATPPVENATEDPGKMADEKLSLTENTSQSFPLKIIRATDFLTVDATEIRLCQLQGKVSAPPVLQVPSWLQSFKTNSIKPPLQGIEIKERQNELGGPFASIFVAVDESATSTKSNVKLKASNAITASQLGWCALAVNVKGATNVGETIYISLAPFPISVPMNKRLLKKDAPVTWTIPLPVHSDAERQPQMTVERLIISIGKKLFSFHATSEIPMAAIELACDQLSSDITSLVLSEKEMITASIQIEADSKAKTPQPSIKLKLDKKKALLDKVRSHLHDQLLMLAMAHEKLLPSLAKTLREISVSDTADPKQFTDVGETIEKMIAPPEKAMSDDAKALQVELRQVKQGFAILHDQVKQHREWVHRLDDCRIVAARISYQIKTSNTDESLTIRIVDFDESEKDQPETKGAN